MSQSETSKWYYSRHGVQNGPVPLETLRAMVSSKAVLTSELAWTDGMPEWKPIESIPLLLTSTQPKPVLADPGVVDNTLWHFTQGGTQMPAQPASVIQQAIDAGNVFGSDMAWREGMVEWRPIMTLNTVFRLPQGNVPIDYSIPPADGPAAGMYANFGWRFLALLVDGVITGIAGQLIGFVADVMLRIPMGNTEAADITVGILNFILGVLLGWLYAASMESSAKQATFGKMLCGLMVTDLDGRRISFARATGRHFGQFVSSLTLGIGYLMNCWTARGQTLHDIMANTLVLKRRAQ